MKTKNKVLIVIIGFFLGLLSGCDPLEGEVKPLEEVELTMWIQVNNNTNETVYFWTTDNSVRSKVGPHGMSTRFDKVYKLFKEGSLIKKWVMIKKGSPGSTDLDADATAAYSFSGGTQNETIDKIFTWNGQTLTLK